MKHRVNEPEFVRKAEANGVVADAVDDFERPEVWLGEFTGGSCCLDVLRQEEDLVAGSDVRGRKAAIVGGALIALLSDLERVGKVGMELVEVSGEFSSA